MNAPVTHTIAIHTTQSAIMIYHLVNNPTNPVTSIVTVPLADSIPLLARQEYKPE